LAYSRFLLSQEDRGDFTGIFSISRIRFIICPDWKEIIHRGIGLMKIKTASQGIAMVAFVIFLFSDVALSDPRGLRWPQEAAKSYCLGAAEIYARTFRASRNPKVVDLDAVLKKTAAYCQRLESSVLDFVCLEEIQETIDPTLDVLPSSSLFGIDDWGWAIGEAVLAGRPRQKIKSSYLYDYQCIRSERAIREMRTLLKENGKKTNVPKAALKTSVVVFGTALMGPVGLFGERFQSQYDYSISGQDKIAKRPVVVIDARPKPGAPQTRNLYGKAWIDPATADILKIEWSENRVGRHEIFDKRGEDYKRSPRLTILSEFRAEKNGIRFPSRLSIEEAYVSDKGRAFVRSKTEVIYKDFKFFTVEVEYR
jgi:hypothetical protein